MAPLVFILLIGGVIALTVYTAHTRRKAWMSFAAEHGLTVEGSFSRPELRGRYRGSPVHVSIVGTNRKSDSQDTLYHVEVNEPLPAGLFVCRQGLLQRIGKVFGAQDITVGNPELDDALMIRGDDMVAIIWLLTIPEVSACVLGMIAAHPDLEIESTLSLRQRGFADPVQLEATLDGLTELAHALEAGCQRLATENAGAFR